MEFLKFKTSDIIVIDRVTPVTVHMTIYTNSKEKLNTLNSYLLRTGDAELNASKVTTKFEVQETIEFIYNYFECPDEVFENYGHKLFDHFEYKINLYENQRKCCYTFQKLASR